MASRLRTRLRASSSATAPSLNLEFATAAGGLDPRVTFSRTTQATLTDSTGRLTYAPNNLLTNSESFEAAAWTKVGGVTVMANAGVAPDGTNTADDVVFSVGGSAQPLRQSITMTVGVVYTVSVFARLVAETPTFTFDIGNGAATSTAQTPTSSWQRFSFTFTFSGANSWVDLEASAAGTIAFWGAQLEAVTYQTTPGTYNSTTPKNLLGFTQEFDNAAWTKNNATVTANATAAPDGTLSADKLVETAVTGSHFTNQNATAIGGTTYTFSVFVKAAERTFAQVRYENNASTQLFAVNINLTTGAFTTTSTGSPTGTAASVTNAGNGWWRVAVTATTPDAGFKCIVFAQAVSGVNSYTGDGTSGILVWGAQLSNSASLDPYVYNPAAAPTSAAFFGPRFDFNPVTLAPRGLLIEEQRANRTLQSEDFTVSPWAATVSGTSTRVNDGAPLGFTRSLITATSATGGIRQGHTGLTSGQVYALSFYIQSASTSVQIVFENGTAGFGSPHNVTINPSNGTAGFLTGFTSVSIQPFGPGYVYTLITAPAGGSLIANIEWRITNSGDSIRFGRPQFEAGAFATSYIPTVASQVTRTADNASMQGANFSSWYSQNAGTLLVEATISPNVDSSLGNYYASISNGTISNTIYIVDVNGTVSRVITGGVTQFSEIVGSEPTGTLKAALAYATNNTVSSANGAIGTTDTSVSLPTVDRLTIGARGDSSSATLLNGHIRSVTYYSTRLTDAQLQAITA